LRLSFGLIVLSLAAGGAAFAAKPPAPGSVITGSVVRVIDGDTLSVLDESKGLHRVRLCGIDAPEQLQPFGMKAQEALAAKVIKQTVRVEVVGVDRFRHEMGRVFLGKRYINMEMVQEGFAWRLLKLDGAEFISAEFDARQHHRGLWADPNPIPPWEWRQGRRVAPKAH
jgi:micrococcal nuclease